MEARNRREQFKGSDIDRLLESVRQRLLQRAANYSDLELVDNEEGVIVRFKTDKSIEEKLSILRRLEGKGLEQPKEEIDEFLSIAERENEEDREDVNLG